MFNTIIPEILNFELNYWLLITFSIFLIFITIKIIFCYDLLSLTLYLSAFSLIIGIIYLIMDAPDVAMTEVSLNACLTTLILISMVKNIINHPIKNKMFINNAVSNKRNSIVKIIISLIICISFVVILLSTLLALPEYGNQTSPISTGASNYYLENTKREIGIDSPVAAILADYRGFDTLGETIVILIAGLGVLLIMINKNNETI